MTNPIVYVGANLLMVAALIGLLAWDINSHASLFSLMWVVFCLLIVVILFLSNLIRGV